MTPAPTPLSESERFDWLRLSRSDGIGPRTFVGLLQRFGSAAATIEAFPRLAKQRSGLRLADADAIRRELDLAAKRGRRIVGLGEPEYPPALRVTDSAPPVITVAGNLAVLQRPMVAVVGSRNASAVGAIFADRLSRGLGSAGFIVVSGLARGIDAKAHLAALPTGTVAVLASGHDRIYPEDHTRLAAEIAEHGAVISEMPASWEARARDFPRRNRIVSGLSLGTVVVEAARRSGSLITARFANEQGREVFAVPGSPLEPRAEGTNDLIRQGATLCASADDVIATLQSMHMPSTPSANFSAWEEVDDNDRLFLDLDQNSGEDTPTSAESPGLGAMGSRDGVLSLLGPVPTSIDDLSRLSGLNAAELRGLLTDLEIDGVVTRHAGDLVSRATDTVS